MAKAKNSAKSKRPKASSRTTSPARPKAPVRKATASAKGRAAASKPARRAAPRAAAKIAPARKTAAKKTAATRKTKAPRTAARRRTPRAEELERLSGLQDFEHIVSQISEHATDISEGEASKFNIGVTHNGHALADRELSAEYGKDRVILLVVDPRFIFSYWEVRQDSMNEANHRLGGDAKLTLRFYDISHTGKPETSPFWDVEVFDRLGNWYLRLAHPEQHLCLDIGMRNREGHFHCIARSNVMRLPPQSLAQPGPIKWMVVSPSGEKLLSDSEEYTDADMALLKKILGPYFFDLLMRGRLASIAGSSVEAVFYDVQQLLRPPAGQPGESPSSGSPWVTSR